jgi:hypothetical protein
VIAFGAAPVKAAAPAGSNPAGTCDLPQETRDGKRNCTCARFPRHVDTDIDLRPSARLANCCGDLIGPS